MTFCETIKHSRVSSSGVYPLPRSSVAREFLNPFNTVFLGISTPEVAMSVHGRQCVAVLCRRKMPPRSVPSAFKHEWSPVDTMCNTNFQRL